MFKKMLCIIICCIMVSLSVGCGDAKHIDGYTYKTYGLVNENEIKNDDIEYRISVGNVVWSIILFETLIAPIYFICFDIYEPIGKINPDAPKGTKSN